MKTMGLLCLVVVLMMAAATPATAWTTTPTNVSFVNSQGLTITGKLFQPAAAGTYPTVVLMHGCSGIFSFSDPTKGVATLFREWGDRLVGAGYVALLVDSFSARPAYGQNQCGNGAAGVSEVTDRPADAFAAQVFLSSHPKVNPNRIGLLGWSHGGSSVMSTMDQTMVAPGSQPFKTAVAFYPGCGLYNAFGGISTSTWLPYAPVVILAAGIDPLYTGGSCDARVNNAGALGASEETGNKVDLVVYAGAQHSFDQAKAGESKWTAADFTAKANADAEAMLQLDFDLKQP